MNAQIEVGSTILVEGADDGIEIVSIKGRWVKLADGRNISRAEAQEGLDAYLLELAELDNEDTNEADAEETESSMAKTIAKHRAKYVKTTNYTGNASLDNGDDVAELLRGLSPDETCAVADHLFNDLPGTHFDKYRHLNAGSRRMNAGNRIRALIKRGESTIEDLQAAIKGDDLIHDEAAV